ncbi:hypothetical protein BKA70DRAFT_1343596 [Coprinopsis sp. MPI-PUGE-AT-0042]|nr:hypothetical protein BKA70DRAFT_1343596 [Coprinopsis sp. MPI-PUGE-AT-0042]
MFSELRRSQALAASLPSELLTAIFRDSLPPIMKKDGRIQFQLLRMVCSKWRQVCFSTPVFWSSLALQSTSDNPESSFYTDIIQAWFSRAGESMPLSLSFDQYPEDTDNTDDLIAFIQSNQNRWRYLSLHIPTRKLWTLLKMCPAKSWSNLRHLDMPERLFNNLDLDNEVERVAVKDHPLEGLDIQQLTLRTYTRVPEFVYPAGRNTVSHMTWYINGTNVLFYQPFLSNYRLLTHLEINCARDTVYWPPDDPNNVVFDSLQSFSFKSSTHNSNWSFLGSFRTPSLSELVLTINRKSDEEESRERGRFGQRFKASPIDFAGSTEGVDSLPPSIRPFLESCSKGSLTRFSLKGYIPPRLFQRIVAFVPGSIASIYLQYWPYGVFGKSRLDHNPPEVPEGKFFPNLESLRIAEVPSDDFVRPQTARSVESLVSFVSHRMGKTDSHVKLMSLGVTRGRESPGCFPDVELDEMEKGGLKVVVWAPST